jgi:hypothetical protein
MYFLKFLTSLFSLLIFLVLSLIFIFPESLQILTPRSCHVTYKIELRITGILHNIHYCSLLGKHVYLILYYKPIQMRHLRAYLHAEHSGNNRRLVIMSVTEARVLYHVPKFKIEVFFSKRINIF